MLTLTGWIAGGAAAVTVTAGDIATLTTTVHGAARIAGSHATRGGVLSAEEIVAVRVSSAQRLMVQPDGAVVRIVATANGRFNVVVEGEKGYITSFRTVTQKTLDRLAKRYGWE
jgi:predicted ThiF/HesA family dinucleotide-utilizing enzyme